MSMDAYFIENISRTSAVSSTMSRSLLSLQAALLVLVYHVGEFFPNGRGPLLFCFFSTIYIVFLHYNGWCWYFYSRWGILS